MKRIARFFENRLMIFKDRGSMEILDPSVIQKFVSNPQFPWLISFPRTGSHWLRMMMELYFEKPSLVRIFYYKDASDFTCYHQHDEDLSVKGPKNVIYLYRAPVDTIYSQMNYYKENLYDIERVIYWSDLYGRHLSKWLFEEGFTEKKTVITYEGLKNSIYDEFNKVCSHLGHEVNKPKLHSILDKVSKEELKNKTLHDKQVVNLTTTYQLAREDFKRKYYSDILDTVISKNAKLEVLFKEEISR